MSREIIGRIGYIASDAEPRRYLNSDAEAEIDRWLVALVKAMTDEINFIRDTITAQHFGVVKMLPISKDDMLDRIRDAQDDHTGSTWQPIEFTRKEFDDSFRI